MKKKKKKKKKIYISRCRLREARKVLEKRSWGEREGEEETHGLLLPFPKHSSKSPSLTT